MTDWFSNDELFRRELEDGHRWAAVVVARFVAAGLPVCHGARPSTWAIGDDCGGVVVLTVHLGDVGELDLCRMFNTI